MVDLCACGFDCWVGAGLVVLVAFVLLCIMICLLVWFCYLGIVVSWAGGFVWLLLFVVAFGRLSASLFLWSV